MKIAALVGSSGSGKTTRVAQLIRHYADAGLRVGAIKHTHHTPNEENRGDTARFREAGAEPVMLAGTNEAVIFRNEGTTRVPFDDPRELVRHFDCDVLLIEGFKDLDAWPRVTIAAEARPTLDELVSYLDRIWRAP